MSIALITLLTVFFVLLALAMPISFSIGIASLSSLLVKGTITLQVIPQKIFTAIDTFTLLAIPLFIFVGDVMVVGGISKRLIALANNMVGWRKGGLAYVTIVASAFFGAISGSAIATTSAIGGLMYPEMVRKKYNPSFAAGVGAASGTLGILIPPSIAFIVFGTQAGCSVTALFLVGAVAGIMVAALYCIAARIQYVTDCSDKNILATKPTKAEFWKAFREAGWGLLTPVIILVGIYSGVFTATESAVIAVMYSIMVGFLIYKELTWKNLAQTAIKTVISSSVILFLIAVAQLFSWILTVEGVATMLQNIIISAGLKKITFLIIVNIIYLVLGMLMETLPIIILTCPIFFPIATALGVDPVHFGLITVVNLAFGLFTPPFGTCLFMANSYSKQPVMSIVAKCKYFFIFGVVAIAIVTYFPGLFMWVVR